MSDALKLVLDEHKDCPWTQVGMCVYCEPHGVRLYNGDLPDAKRTIPKCDVHTWDEEQGMGFYFICEVCGVKEWPED